MKILDRLPIPKQDLTVNVNGEPVRIKQSEIIVWVRFGRTIQGALGENNSRFPAILDTGHTHNFVLRHHHLTRWAGQSEHSLKRLGHIRHGTNRLPLYDAHLWLHSNDSAMATIRDRSHRLLMPGGIAVYPDSANYPRLPLLGLRALLSNDLHLTLDGQDAHVTLRTSDWRTDLVRWLA